MATMQEAGTRKCGKVDSRLVNGTRARSGLNRVAGVGSNTKQAPGEFTDRALVCCSRYAPAYLRQALFVIVPVKRLHLMAYQP